MLAHAWSAAPLHDYAGCRYHPFSAVAIGLVMGAAWVRSLASAGVACGLRGCRML